MTASEATAPSPEPGGARTAVAGHIDFTASLETFQGPLDLLLYLIKENEVDILDIPISRVLDQYLKFMDQATQWDLQLAGEFLVMATTLMEIKSRELLPVQQQAADAEEIIEDPRSELVRQLLEYRRLKEQAQFLETMQDRWFEYRPRGMKDEIIEPPSEDDPEADRAAAKEALVDVDLYGLFAAYEKILKATLSQTPRNIVYDGESIEEKIKRIEEALKAKPFARFVELVKDPSNRADIASTFVALLELVRRRAVRLIQQQEYGGFEVKVQNEAEADELSKKEAAEAEAAAHDAQQGRNAREAAQAAEGAEKLPWNKRRAPARPKFEGIVRPEEVDEIDNDEHEIGRKVDAILAAADAISERFEQSREGKVRFDDDGTVASNDAALNDEPPPPAPPKPALKAAPAKEQPPEPVPAPPVEPAAAAESPAATEPSTTESSAVEPPPSSDAAPEAEEPPPQDAPAN